MKTIIFFALLALSLAFIPEPSFLDLSHDNVVSDISDNTKENSLNQLMNERPRLQRQNAIRFPLSDSEDQDGLETSDSDTFQVDQTYFQGLNGSFTELYNQWKKEDEEREAKGLNVAQDEEIVEKNPIKESFDKAENVFEGIFDEILGALQELSKEAEEKKTILGVDKASFKGTFESAKADFEKVFDQALVGLSQLYNKPESSLLGVDKESVKEGLVELEGNVDEIFDETLSALTDLGREAVEKNTIFGFGKDDIKKFFGQSEESFEKILKEFPIDFAGLLDKDVEVKETVNPDIGTDETDMDNASTRESLSDDDVDLDEILLAVRNLFSETVEDNALFNTKVNSDSSDSFDVDHTYFNGLDSNFNQDLANKLVGDKEVNFDELLTVLGGLVNAAMEKGSEQSQE